MDINRASFRYHNSKPLCLGERKQHTLCLKCTGPAAAPPKRLPLLQSTARHQAKEITFCLTS